jgi:hypothetical protein
MQPGRQRVVRCKSLSLVMFIDAISTRHIAEFFALLGGGLKVPGWQSTQLTNARLAIVRGYSHYNFTTAPELGPIIEGFLADPLTKPKGGEAAASKAAN